MGALTKTIKLAVGTGFVVLLVLAGGIGYELYNEFTRARRMQEEQVRRLEEEVARQQERLARMREMIDRLSGERQVAECHILEQIRSAEGEVVGTKLRFQEVDAQGVPLSSRPGQEFYIQGDIVHVDALVIQFNEDLVAKGDPLRGKSLHLFHRIYGEHRAPKDGFLLNELNHVPEAWDGADRPDPFIASLWKDFWRLANDPAARRERGVEVMQGEGVYFKAICPMVYTLQLENAGGLTVQPASQPIPRPAVQITAVAPF